MIETKSSESDFEIVEVDDHLSTQDTNWELIFSVDEALANDSFCFVEPLEVIKQQIENDKAKALLKLQPKIEPTECDQSYETQELTKENERLRLLYALFMYGNTSFSTQESLYQSNAELDQKSIAS